MRSPATDSATDARAPTRAHPHAHGKRSERRPPLCSNGVAEETYIVTSHSAGSWKGRGAAALFSSGHSHTRGVVTAGKTALTR